MATQVHGETTLLTDEIRSFLGATPARYAAIATVNRDGNPHQNVIWYLLRSDERGDYFVLNSRRGRLWPTNLERTRRASLAIDDRAHADIDEMAVRYDPPERANARMERFRDEERVSFILRPTRVHTHGDP